MSRVRRGETEEEDLSSSPTTIMENKQKIFIIAEMAWSYDGSVALAKKIIKGAADAGADAISCHLTSVKDYVVKNYGCSAGQTLSAGREKENIYNFWIRTNMKDKNWQILFPYARSLGLKICVMPNDLASLRLAQKLKTDIYVISGACFVDEDFIIEVAKVKKPIILRIGGATLGEIENTINLIKKQGQNDITLLHGIQLYPTKIENTQLSLIPALRKIFGLPVGLADHLDGDWEVAKIVPLLSIPLGATVIEKHITHDRSKRGEDFEAALNPDELKKFVGYVREAEKAMGCPNFRPLSEAELKYRLVSRKKTVAAKNIKKGEKITKNNVVFKRSDAGVSPADIKYLIGRTLNCDIKEEEPILWEKFK